jgi:hypothetical protein
VSRSHQTLWEEGNEPGRQVVLLGLALVLTAVALDIVATDHVGWLFDLGFVAACLGVALAVRQRDFFTVGVLPPLLMMAVFLLLGATRPAVIADRTDGVVQAVVSGLAHHATALVVGYALCLGVLAVRHRVLTQARDHAQDQARQAASNRLGSPAPTRTISG